MLIKTNTSHLGKIPSTEFQTRVQYTSCQSLKAQAITVGEQIDFFSK